MQEGPSWFFNDYSIVDQFHYYNQIAESDIIFCHNIHDIKWYKGLFPNKDVRVMQTLMIDHLVKDIEPKKENKVMIGGNFVSAYGGFDSYIVAKEMSENIHAPTTGRMKEEEAGMEINHLPWVMWLDWIYELKLTTTHRIVDVSLSHTNFYFTIPSTFRHKSHHLQYRSHHNLLHLHHSTLSLFDL